ncbi:MAG: hypothetical protein AB1467_05890 [Candidatus Diapherotrites archaeon]
MKKNRMQKGFLGPIGDDLPSLIPLLFALTIFFSVFYFALTEFTNKADSFDNDVAVVQISNALRGTGLVSGHSSLRELCASLNVKTPKYIALIIKDANLDLGELEPSIESEENSSGPSNKFECSNTSKSLSESISELKKESESPSARIVSRVFPIALDKDSVIEQKFLVVIAWS